MFCIFQGLVVKCCCFFVIVIGYEYNCICFILAKDFTLKHLTLLKWRDCDGKNRSLRLRDEMSSKWRDVGDLLEIDSSRLDCIHAHRMGDVRLCCRDILLDWLQMEDNSYPASWEGLLVLLEDLELNNVAKKLNEALDCFKNNC